MGYRGGRHGKEHVTLSHCMTASARRRPAAGLQEGWGVHEQGLVPPGRMQRLLSSGGRTSCQNQFMWYRRNTAGEPPRQTLDDTAAMCRQLLCRQATG